MAFWLYGTGESFGACNGSEKITLVYGVCAAGVACVAPTTWESAGGINTAVITLGSNYSYTAGGLRAVLTHELGHLFGLWEQYIEPSNSCDNSIDSIMDKTQANLQGTITGVCDENFNSVQGFDYSLVQPAFTSAFDPTPIPQLLWAEPQGSSLRLTFKAPNVSSRVYQRSLCNANQWVNQSLAAVINTDVAYMDLALPPENGPTICIHIRAVGGNGSWGVHYGHSNQPQGDVVGAWTHVYNGSSMMNVMYNKSSVVDIPKTRLTTNTTLLPFPVCAVDEFLARLQSRSCHKEWAGEGAMFWW